MPLTHLGDIAVELFLKDYWQKKPLLIRNALMDIPDLEADIIAGFALDEDVESRILIETTASDPLKSQWQLLHGPQREKTFEQLPATHWTLLVQAVDQLAPEIHELLHKFRFIPNWRVDDIMVSYAADQGGVGPHFDYYDVFLLQAQGSRLWKLGQHCDASSELRKDSDCKILTQFDTQEEWLVNPGDLLYIPPGVAHWGIAQGECITYSIGFRAPSVSEILLDYTQHLTEDATEDQRFTDRDLSLRDNAGAIRPEDLARIKSIIEALTNNEDKLAHWFGSYMTQIKRDSPTFELTSNSKHPKLAANCRAAYLERDEQELTSLFINGEHYRCSLTLAKAICGYHDIIENQYTSSDQALICQLNDEGILIK